MEEEILTHNLQVVHADSDKMLKIQPLVID